MFISGLTNVIVTLPVNLTIFVIVMLFVRICTQKHHTDQTIPTSQELILKLSKDTILSASASFPIIVAFLHKSLIWRLAFRTLPIFLQDHKTNVC